MDYNDKDPDRRNLVIFSLMFIVYFIGDGEFKSGDIDFQIINLHLNNLEALAYFAWGLLFWFFYRYILNHHSTFFHLMNEELSTLCDRKYVREYVESKLNITLAPVTYHPITSKLTEKGWFIHGLWLFGGKYHIGCLQLEDARRTFPTGRIDMEYVKTRLERGTVQRSAATFEGFRGWLTLFRLFLDYCLVKPNFSTNLFPVLLFLAAVLVGLVEIYCT